MVPLGAAIDRSRSERRDTASQIDPTRPSESTPPTGDAALNGGAPNKPAPAASDHDTVLNLSLDDAEPEVLPKPNGGQGRSDDSVLILSAAQMVEGPKGPQAAGTNGTAQGHGSEPLADQRPASHMFTGPVEETASSGEAEDGDFDGPAPARPQTGAAEAAKDPSNAGAAGSDPRASSATEQTRPQSRPARQANRDGAAPGGIAGPSPHGFRPIARVAREVGVTESVLRYWEAKFSAIQPMKRGGGRRFYRPEDVWIAKAIKILMEEHDRGVDYVERFLVAMGSDAVIVAVRDGRVPMLMAQFDARTAPRPDHTSRDGASTGPEPVRPEAPPAWAPDTAGEPAEPQNQTGRAATPYTPTAPAAAQPRPPGKGAGTRGEAFDFDVRPAADPLPDAADDRPASDARPSDSTDHVSDLKTSQDGSDLESESDAPILTPPSETPVAPAPSDEEYGDDGNLASDVPLSLVRAQAPFTDGPDLTTSQRERLAQVLDVLTEIKMDIAHFRHMHGRDVSQRASLDLSEYGLGAGAAFDPFADKASEWAEPGPKRSGAGFFEADVLPADEADKPENGNSDGEVQGDNRENASDPDEGEDAPLSVMLPKVPRKIPD